MKLTTRPEAVSETVRQVVDALNAVLGGHSKPIPLHQPHFEGREWEYVKECLDTGWVSSVGQYVNRFEEMLAEACGTRKAIVTVNGTAALHMCLVLVGVKPGDEVLIPTLSFVATANAVAYCGAIPHFVDSTEATLGVDPAKLALYLKDVVQVREGEAFNRKTGRRIWALVPMHTFGHPVEIEPLVELCHELGIQLVEDAAESLGSYYKGRHTGNWGRVAALSFNGNKIITTGGGGAILTNDDELARRAKHLTTTAKQPHPWLFQHDEVGYNYRLPNVNSAMGCAQLEKLPEYLAKKRKLAERYEAAFRGVSGVRFFKEPASAQSNYWLNVILLDESVSSARDGILKATNESGMMTRPAWELLHTLPMFAESPRMDLSTAESLLRRLINIPSSVQLGV